MKKLLLVNFIITYTLIVFPFPFSNMEKSLMYNKIGYFYINHIVMPEYGFFKCSTFVSCNGKFPKYLTKVKIKEFSSEWQIKDFVKKIDYPPYRLVNNIEELNTINESLKDAGKNYYYIVTSSAGQGEEAKKVTDFFVLLFFIFLQYILYKIETYIINKNK